MSARRAAGAAAILALALAATTLSRPAPVEACAVLAPREVEAQRRPSLALEQTLILFDAARGRQHFIREVVFRRGASAFGFVVPTPSRPEVHKMAVSPFARLRADFPFSGPPRPAPTQPTGQGFGSDAAGVKVLERKLVGSFTTFVLAASDDAALRRWLATHGFDTGPEVEVWLRRHVEQGSHFVAMRHDPSRAPRNAGDDPTPRAETLRISYDTPLPHYPYAEPDRPLPDGRVAPRHAEVWLVSTGLYLPLAARATGQGAEWLRPMVEGHRHAPADRVDLAAALGVEQRLLPPGDLNVQRFADQKRSRAGIGDVVFVPAAPARSDAARTAALERLAPILDPTLAGGR